MATLAERAPARPRPKIGRDQWALRGLAAIIATYLVVTLALPLWAMVSKSFTVYEFRFDLIEIAVDDAGRLEFIGSLDDWVSRLDEPVNHGLAPTARTRIGVDDLIAPAGLDEAGVVRVIDTSETGGLLYYDGAFSAPGQALEVPADELGRVLVRAAPTTGLGNYLAYVSAPALRQSLWNSLTIATITTVITVSVAFLFAFALTRSCMPAKGLFRTIAMVPILVPSLLPGIGLVYLFGQQGMIKELLFGHDIYGPIGIVIASCFFTFPHALVIILIALAAGDARLYEAATALRARPPKVFFTVTLPGASYGVLSAAFVVFNLVITDFGVPKVIGGSYDVLALDIYKQVVGQQNFEMGAVVSMILLIPALVAFTVDRMMQRRQVALISSSAVPYRPRTDRRFDLSMLALCILVSVFILGILGVCQYAALIKFWPYNLEVGLQNYAFDRFDGGGWASYWNSIRMALWTAGAGTIIVFLGAYVVEKARGFRAGRSTFHLFAMMPMAVPGMVLGLAYVFFFNAPDNPLNALYGTMALLVICTITHFYSVSHLTAVTALKQIDPEFEAVNASLGQPVWRVLALVTVPVCLPAILDISIYLFVNAMTTVSAVVFLYSPDTTLASVAVLNMDDAGDIAPAAAMGMMIFYTNVGARLIHAFLTRGVLARTQAWRAG